MAWLLSLVVAAALQALCAMPASAQQAPPPPARVALVIANGSYPQAGIPGAIEDGRVVAATLREGGFDTVLAEDTGRTELRGAIATFAGKLKRGAEAVVFYTGHALQQRGRNFLVPVPPQNAEQDAVDLDELIDTLIVARPANAFIFIDASRDNPWQPAGRGLLPVEPLERIAVMFSAAPGRTVADTGARASRTVDEWLKAIRTPNLDTANAAKRAQDAIARATRRAQLPWLSSEPPAGLVVTRPAAVAQNDRAVIPPLEGRGAPPDAYELAFWETIRNSESAAEYRAYLDAYPSGRFASLARAREQLYRAKPSPSAPPPAATAAVAPPPPAPPAARPAPPAAPAAPATPASPATLRDCSGCPEIAAIPAGSFQMGSNDLYEFEKPVHPVTIKAFYLGTREVTYEEWDLCVDQGGCSYRPDDRGLGRGKRPVADVHWNDANAYLAWLSARTGKRYRLPTESEWEYAARAGTASTYSWGQAMVKDRANCNGCNDQPRRATVSVGQYPPNDFGLYDMAGNAAEWVADCWSDSYRTAARDGSAYNVPACRERVLRGGSFNNDPRYLRSAARFKYDADVRFYTNGFRVAREP